MHTHTLSLSLTHTHTYTHTHSLSLSLSLTHTHTHTHTHTPYRQTQSHKHMQSIFQAKKKCIYISRYNACTDVSVWHFWLLNKSTKQNSIPIDRASLQQCDVNDNSVDDWTDDSVDDWRTLMTLLKTGVINAKMRLGGLEGQASRISSGGKTVQ